MKNFQEWAARKDYPVVTEIEELVDGLTAIWLEVEDADVSRYRAQLNKVYSQTFGRMRQMVNQVKDQIKDTLARAGGGEAGYQSPWGGKVPVQQTVGAQGIDTSTQASSFAQRARPKSWLGRMFSHVDPQLSKALGGVEELCEQGLAPAGGAGFTQRLQSPARAGWQNIPGVDQIYDRMLEFLKKDLESAMIQAYKLGQSLVADKTLAQRQAAAPPRRRKLSTLPPRPEQPGESGPPDLGGPPAGVAA